MVKKVGPMLCELAPVDRGSQIMGSRNLGSHYLTIPVQVERLAGWLVALAMIGAIWNLSAMRNRGKTD